MEGYYWGVKTYLKGGDEQQSLFAEEYRGKLFFHQP